MNIPYRWLALHMTKPIRIAAQIQPGGVHDYRTWRDAVVRAEETGAEQPDVNNFRTCSPTWPAPSTTSAAAG
jgi:hypothetical protein